MTADKKIGYFFIKGHRTQKLQEKPSALKKEHPAPKHELFSIFVGYICPPGSGSCNSN
jgi:hypothetical protein